MLRLALKISLFILVIGLLSFTGLFLYVWPQLPDIEELRDVRLQTPLRIYSHEGSFIREIGEVRRVPLEISEVPPILIQAVLATEDTRFYQHPGFDLQGIARAAIGYIQAGEVSQQGGASTITMQLAGHFYLDRSEITIKRKIMEAFLSIKIERELSKDEILELYLNTYYLGHRAYGVGAAAQVYYGTTIENLTLAQYAMIAGLFQRPGKVNPVTNPEASFNRRNHVLDRMLTESYISQAEFNATTKIPETASLHLPAEELEAPYLAEMVRLKLIEDYGEDAVNEGYKVYTTIRRVNQSTANRALRKALQEYDKRHGYRGPEHHLELAQDMDAEAIEQFLSTFSIIAEMRPAIITAIMESSVVTQIQGVGRVEMYWEGMNWARRYINENRRGPEPKGAADIFQVGDIVRVKQDEYGQWQLTQIPDVEGALVSVDPNNGSLLALVGGFDFNRSKFNRVTQAIRQPGSSFKPFIYSAALEHGYTAASLVNDAPITVTGQNSGEVWRPQNDNQRSYGPVRLRRAITRSLNQVSARLLEDIGIDNGLQHLAKFGFDVNRMPHNFTIALGSEGISPWESATAYSVLANGGYRIEPYFIERIEDYKGNVVYSAASTIVCHTCDEQPVQAEPVPAAVPTPSTAGADAIAQPIKEPLPAVEHPEPIQKYAERTVDARNVYVINSLTRSVIHDPGGTGNKAQVLNRKDLSGKTGTTNDQRDAWFAGYNSSVVTIAWVGFDDFNRLGSIEFGSKAALPMWVDYMRVALADIPDVIMPEPPGLINILIDPITGRPTAPGTPGAFLEIFKEENAPKELQEGETPALIQDLF
ncbi:MAG: peptidase [Gammaproteobacteria bacterium]|nr:peptidase [Gammaproteobacteria bacterium]